MNNKIILLILPLLYSSISNAAILFTEKVGPDGKLRLYASQAQDVAKNCPGKVREIIDKRSQILEQGSYGGLFRLYSPSAGIYQKTIFLDNPARYNSYDTSSLITALRDSRKLLAEYSHLQLNGQCEKNGSYYIYSGKEVEKLVVSGKTPVYSTTEITLKIDKNSFRIVESDESVVIKYKN